MGQLVENEVPSLFLIALNCFQFSFSSNLSIDLLQHSHFQASKLYINVPVQGSRVSLENFGFPGPLGTQVPLKECRITGPT